MNPETSTLTVPVVYPDGREEMYDVSCIETFPEEILFNIPFFDLMKLRAVSEKIRRVLIEDEFWKRKTEKEFGEIDLDNISCSFGIYRFRTGTFHLGWQGKYRAYLQKLVPELIKFSRQGNEKEVKKLLFWGVDPNTFGKEARFNALFAASKRGHLNIVDLLLTRGYADPTLSSLYGYTAILAAVLGNHGPVIRRLVEAGANPNGEIMGMNQIYPPPSPLYESLYSRNYETIETLLKLGVDPERGLLWSQDNKAIQLLIEYGANPNFRGSGDETPLLPIASKISSYLYMLKESYPNSNTVRMLVDQGADVNHQNFHGETPLMYYAAKENTRSVRILIDAGANVNHRNKNGESVLDVVRNIFGATLTPKQSKIISLLESEGAV